MILIEKGREPHSLTEYKKQPYASYDNCNKDDIRESLLQEQGYLCAYCMRRISKAHMKIEHWYPESKSDEAGRMDYSNMLGCCEGHKDHCTHSGDTCDTHKGDTELTLTPLNRDHIAKIKYRTGTGEIYSEDSVIDHDLNVTLNLNCQEQYLKENRKAVLNTIKNRISKKGTLSRTEWERILKMYTSMDNAGQRKEYAGIAIWYINRKLKKL